MSDARELRVLQRVVFPPAGSLDIVPLYVETNMDRGASLVGSSADDFDEDADEAQTAVASAVPGEAQSAIVYGSTSAQGTGDLASRRSGKIAAGRRVSFGSYFNAFPASYWRRWTVVDEVVLRIRVDGECSIIVYRSTAKGKSHPVKEVHIDSDSAETVEITLPLKQFIDGGWYWFDIAAASTEVTVVEADWAARVAGSRYGTFSIGITTFNRPDFCVDGLRVLSEAPDVLEILDNVYVVDQGTQRIEDHPEFSDATKGLGEKLKVITQGNLGGSGGFSRGMDETVSAGVSDYVLLLDDDVVTEPESMLRAVTFADLARKPTIVGGHMFSLYDRSVLHAFGETVAKYSWWWGAAPRTRTEHDFGRRNLRHTPWLHRRIDVDYNGWWMCLIPTSVVRQLGLALPVFIKWDDAEYGLRAKEVGVPTVSMPGVAVWHIPWQDKNDALDWQAYYHLRNRLVAALMHSPYPRGGSIVSRELPVPGAALALDAVFDGPDADHGDRGRAGRPATHAPRHPDQDGRAAGTARQVSGFADRAGRRELPVGTSDQAAPPRQGADLTAQQARLCWSVPAGCVAPDPSRQGPGQAAPAGVGRGAGRGVVGAVQRRRRGRLVRRRNQRVVVPTRSGAVPHR